MNRHQLSARNFVGRRHDDSHGHSPLPPTKVKTIFISDVHLGTRDCKAKQLNSFLSQYRCEQLYLVGDIFDGWKMKKGVYWTADFNKIIRKVLKLSKKGTDITYITGNHDEFLRRYANQHFDNIRLCNRAIHQTLDGQHFLVLHGDQFEGIARCSPLLKIIGDVGYGAIMRINRWYNHFRSRFGYGYWSFSHFLKQRIQRAQDYILDYEKAAVYLAKKQGFDGVICGHIHLASAKKIDGIQYFNTGDWVESCTAVIEQYDGEFKLIHYGVKKIENKQLPKSTVEAKHI